MPHKIIAVFVIAGMSLAACASLPQDSPEVTEPPMTEAPDTPTQLTSTPDSKSGGDRTPSGDQPILGPGSDRSPLEPIPGEDKMVRGGVILDKTEILVLESFPPQIHLRLEGSQPTPCHKLRAELVEPIEGNQIQVELYTLVDPDQICTQVLQPFEVTIDLGSYPQGEYEVIVNGEAVGSFTL